VALRKRQVVHHWSKLCEIHTDECNFFRETFLGTEECSIINDIGDFTGFCMTDYSYVFVEVTVPFCANCRCTI
jgi:hypothetical protein